MEFIGNYKELIKDEWLTFLYENDGQLLPDDRECLEPDYNEQNQMIKSSWGGISSPSWYKFEIKDLPFKIEWPVPLSKNPIVDWWIIKQKPGQVVPMHIDDDPDRVTRRYTMFLQDYIPGHLTLWGDTFLKDYKVGDLYKAKDSIALHGSANVSTKIRLVAFITIWDYPTIETS